MKKLFLMLALLSNAACVQTIIDKQDSLTGLYPTARQATIIKSKPINIDSMQEFILVTVGSNLVLLESSYAFNIEATKNIGFFNQVMDYDDLEVFLIQQGFADQAQKLKSKISLNTVAKHYKPFLWLRTRHREENRNHFIQLVLTNTLTFEDYFIAETPQDDIWVGITPEKNWYPMMNAFIKYIDTNSKTYSK